MRVGFRVTGRVQGVGFRWFVRRQAQSLALAGWVRNEPDGQVAVAAEGTPEALAALRAVLEQGPAGAQVEAVEATPLDGSATLPNPFEIK